jgi:hypothetical protein
MNIMLTQAARSTVAIALLFLVGACVKVGHIQQKEPVRTMSFTGSPKAVAQCIQTRVGGKVQEEGFGGRYVIYDSVKGAEREYGITHYSVTVSQVSANEGVAALRVATGAADSTYYNVPPGSSASETGGLRDITAQKYWTPVVRCVEQAKGKS